MPSFVVASRGIIFTTFLENEMTKKEAAKIAELHDSFERLERILIETVETYRIATKVMMHAIGEKKIDKAANEILTKEEWEMIK